MDKEIEWPVKQREVYGFCMDSTYWNDFKFRDDDIIIATWAKCGTTWVQQIVAQFIFNGETDDLPIGDMSMWVDFRIPSLEVKTPILEAQTHRRFMKTHLPLYGLVFKPFVKHIYIARDGRDMMMSAYHAHKYMLPWVFEEFDKLEPMGHRFDPLTDETSPRDYFMRWLTEDGAPYWTFWDHIKSWWDARDLPNVMVIHYQNLKDDMEGMMLKIGEFLGYEKPADEELWKKMVLHCTFDYMKKNAPASAPLQGSLWEGGAETFVNKGTNGRWKDVLTKEDSELYEKMAVEKLGEECAYWLETGKFK